MKRILVVDDERTIRDVLADVLVDEGYQIALAANGHEALERVRNERPHLVLMDVMMPHLSGDEALRRMRADQTLNGLKIVLMSAAPCPADARPDGFLSKPFEFDALVACVLSMLERLPE